MTSQDFLPALVTDTANDVPIDRHDTPTERSSGEKSATLDFVFQGSDNMANDKSEIEGKHGVDDFPDGGLRAWIIVVGAGCSCFSSFGLVNSWGVFQAYYEETLLRDFSPSAIAWIGSIQYSLIFFPGLIVGRLFDIGYFHAVFGTSNTLLVVAAFLTAQCTQYWQFLLCQGIIIGVASSGLYGCSNAVVAHWFKKMRGRAVGYMSFGTAIGGTVIPISAKNLIPLVGFPWTMRIIGFILVVTNGISVLRRLPPVNIKGGLFNWAVFKEAQFTVYTISSFMMFLGIYTVLTYIGVSAKQLGVAPELAFYLVSVSNASSLFGRFAAGVFVDRFGSLNVMIPFAFMAGVLTYIWPFMRSTASLIVIIVMYGWCCGSYTCLIVNPVMNFGGEGDVGRRVGMYLTAVSIGSLAGPPISGAINARTGGFEAVGAYAGSVIILGIICMIIVRFLVLKQWIGRV